MVIKIALCLLFAGFIYLVWKRRLMLYSLKRVLLSLFSLLAIISVVFVLLRQMPIEGYFDNYD